MSARKGVVETYFEGFRRSDHGQALACLTDDADTVVAIGTGETTHKSGELRRFAFCDVFTFACDRIVRVESYLVPFDIAK